MTAIISAACTFPSGPTLPLANVARRLQFSLVRKHPLCVDQCGFPVKACYFPEIIFVTPEERFRLLTRQVLTELMEHQAVIRKIVPRRIWLLLPPTDRPGMTAELVVAVKDTVTDVTGWHDCEIRVLHGGQAEIASVIEAFEDDQSGSIEILLAVDSWLPPSSLMWLDEHNLLHSSIRYFKGKPRPNPYGRIPSEGAAALALSGFHSGVTPWCFIRDSGIADETVLYSDKEGVCLGKGLIQATLLALRSNQASSIRNVISDVNGEPYRSDELGFTLLRIKDYLADNYQRETPVLASGDLGCANLLMHLAVAAWQMSKSQYQNDVLILSSSDDKRRSAIVLSNNREKDFENVNN
ncbi:hypothetical protein FNZ18_23105 [Salmonella enterica subsp. salamae]|nr:hypothetical protein [Salmonella enterica subsp. salamae]